MSFLLEQETAIDLTTIWRVRTELEGKSADNTDDRIIAGIIKRLSLEAMKRIMHRAIEKKERTEYFDILDGQQSFYILGWPIDTGEDITIIRNTETPRIWTQSDDEVDSDYVVCDARRAARGEILIEKQWVGKPNSLKITYTGGMAARCCLTGSDGSSVAAGTTFTAAGATFTTHGVAIGHELIINGGTNDGIYKITAPTDQTHLAVTPAFAATVSDQKWEVSTGFIESYRDISEAVCRQAAYEWQQRGREGVKGEAFLGLNVTMMRPVNWLYENMNILMAARRDY